MYMEFVMNDCFGVLLRRCVRHIISFMNKCLPLLCFLIAMVWFLVDSYDIHVSDNSSRIAPLKMEQSHDCPVAIEVDPQSIVKIDSCPTTSTAQCVSSAWLIKFIVYITMIYLFYCAWYAQ